MLTDNQKKMLTSDHSDFTKVYRAVVWSSSPLTEVSGDSGDGGGGGGVMVMAMLF